MTVQILDMEGNAIDRYSNVKSLAELEDILKNDHPRMDDYGYTMEIFY